MAKRRARRARRSSSLGSMDGFLNCRPRTPGGMLICKRAHGEKLGKGMKRAVLLKSAKRVAVGRRRNKAGHTAFGKAAKRCKGRTITQFRLCVKRVMAGKAVGAKKTRTLRPRRSTVRRATGRKTAMGAAAKKCKGLKIRAFRACVKRVTKGGSVKAARKQRKSGWMPYGKRASMKRPASRKAKPRVRAYSGKGHTGTAWNG